MKRTSLYLFCLLSAYAFVLNSCNQDAPDTLKVDTTDLTFPAKGGQQTIQIDASNAWSLQTTSSWITTNIASGRASASVLITVDKNHQSSERQGTITIKLGNINRTINIKQGAITIQANVSSLLFAQTKDDSKAINITSSDKWWIELTGDTKNWLSVSPTIGEKDGAITLTTLSQNGNDPRAGSFDIVTEAQRLTIKVWQEGKDKMIPDAQVKTLKESTAGKNPVEIFITGDGYSAKDMIVGGKFEQDANLAMTSFMDIEPYNTYRDYLKFVRLSFISDDSGITQSDKSINKNTVFNTEFYGNSAIRFNGNNETAKIAMDKICQLLGRTREQMANTPIIMMCNADRYGGVCYMYGDGAAIALCPTSQRKKAGLGFIDLIHHEAGGHAFGGLCDEYITKKHGERISTDDAKTFTDWQAWGFYPNTDIGGNKDTAKWSHFYGLSGYNVGYFEGSYFYELGAWKPEPNSVMIDNRPYYNAPSRENIVKTLLRRAAGVKPRDQENGNKITIPNDPFNFQTFVAKDVQKSEPANLRNAVQAPMEHPVCGGMIMIKE